MITLKGIDANTGKRVRITGLREVELIDEATGERILDVTAEQPASKKAKPAPEKATAPAQGKRWEPGMPQAGGPLGNAQGWPTSGGATPGPAAGSQGHSFLMTEDAKPKPLAFWPKMRWGKARQTIFTPASAGRPLCGCGASPSHRTCTCGGKAR